MRNRLMGPPLVAAIVFVLFVLVGALGTPTACAVDSCGGCASGFVCTCRSILGHVSCTCEPASAPVLTPGNGPIPESPGREPAPRNAFNVGAAGGDVNSPGEDATVRIPRDVLPDGSQVVVSRPYPNDLKPGSFVLRGDGDHLITVSITDANGNPITSLNGPITVCFNVPTPDVETAGGAQNLSIQVWDGSKWVNMPSSSGAAPPMSSGAAALWVNAMIVQVCTQFSGF